MTTNRVFRFIQALLVAFFGLYALVVAFGNVTDYGSNFAFVKGVLSMTTTFEGNALMYRSIDSVALYHIAYIAIIIVEWIIAIICIVGAIKLFKNMAKPYERYHEAKKWGLIGLVLAECVWFFGFQVVGGEWFAMWQSETWNGVDTAFRLTTFITATIIILMMKESNHVT